MKKAIGFVFVCLVISVLSAFPSFAFGWTYYSGGWHYFKADNSIYKNETAVIDGVSRTFNERGICETGFHDPIKIPDQRDKTDQEKKVESMADSVLKKILKPKMTEREKCEAIYDWIRGNMSYVEQSVKEDWTQAAYDGFRSKSGDCYTYYGVSTALLTRAGFPCMEVNRITDGRHWWVKVKLKEGWYHFDATPRAKDDRRFCLYTDAQLLQYSAEHTNYRGYNTHNYDVALYPASPER